MSSAYPIVHQRFQRKVVNPIPQKWVKEITSQKLWLINLTEQTYVYHRTYGHYLIRGVEPGQEYTAILITGRIEHIDQGDEKYMQQLTEAEDIASDLAMQANQGILGPDGVESFMGVFVSPTEKPSAAVLAEMRKKLSAFDDGQIKLADEFWDEPRTHKEISALHRRCAKRRNQTRPWTYESVNTTACPACGSSIRSGMAICMHCSAIVDEEKARKFFPERFADASPAAEPRPRKSKTQPPVQP